MFRKHSRCPECTKRGQDKSGNNLGIYDDGEYCFACGYTRRPQKLLPEYQSEIRRKFDRQLNPLPLHWYQYLEAFGLSDSTIKGNFGYDSDSDRLCQVCVNYIEARSLTQKPKIISYGEKPLHVYPIFPVPTSLLIMVEDGISALKVSLVAPCTPLFGASISKKWFTIIEEQKYKPIIWLDKDKLEQAKKYRDQFRALGLESNIIFSPKDPKYYFKYEIFNFIKKASLNFSKSTKTLDVSYSKSPDFIRNPNLGLPMDDFSFDDPIQYLKKATKKKVFPSPPPVLMTPAAFLYYKTHAADFFGYEPTITEVYAFAKEVSENLHPEIEPYTINTV